MGRTISWEAADANDTRQTLVGIVQVLVFIATAIAYLRWIYRAHKNLPALAATGLKFTPGWAVGLFLVPILNLYRPYQVVGEIWKASDPRVDVSDGTAWQKAGTSAIVGLWWSFWIIGEFLDRIVSRAMSNPKTLDQLVTSDWLSIVSDALTLITALLAALVVREIESRQEEKSRRLLLLGVSEGPSLSSFYGA